MCFRVLLDRANSWLAGGRYSVVSCELVEIEGSHSVTGSGDTDNDDDDEDFDDENKIYIAFLTALR